MLTRLYPTDLETKFPNSLKAMRLTEEDLESSDYCFYVLAESLHCESSDERMAFKFDGERWHEVEWPLKRD